MGFRTNRSARAAVAGVLLAAAFTFSAASTAAAATTQVVGGNWAGGGEFSRATCPDGTHLIGGGYDWYPVYTNGGSPADTVDTNAPSLSDQKSWVARSHTPGYCGQIRAYAICETDS